MLHAEFVYAVNCEAALQYFSTVFLVLIFSTMAIADCCVAVCWSLKQSSDIGHFHIQ